MFGAEVDLPFLVREHCCIEHELRVNPEKVVPLRLANGDLGEDLDGACTRARAVEAKSRKIAEELVTHRHLPADRGMLLIRGKLSSHASKSSLRMSVRRPAFRAARSPVLMLW